MANSTPIDARESVASRYALHYELLGDRLRLSTAMKATLVARFGHFGLLFGLFFLTVIAPSTLADVSLFDYKALFVTGPGDPYIFDEPGIIILGAILLVDYIGRLLVRGMRFTLFRQLHGGTETVEDWRDHLAQSARRLHKVFLLELLTILAALVGLSLLIVVGLYVLYIAGPISHYVIARDEPLVAGIKKGVALAHRHPGELVPRFLIKIAWRFFALAVVAGGLTAIWYYKTMYLPLASLLVGVGFFAIRPFILHFGLMRSEALLSTLQQLDGELQLAEE